MTIIIFCVFSPAQSYLPSVLIRFQKHSKAESHMRYSTLLSIIHFPLPLSELISIHPKEGGLSNSLVLLLTASKMWWPLKTAMQVYLVSTVTDPGHHGANYPAVCVFWDSSTHSIFQIIFLIHAGYRLSLFSETLTSLVTPHLHLSLNINNILESSNFVQHFPVYIKVLQTQKSEL